MEWPPTVVFFVVVVVVVFMFGFLTDLSSLRPQDIIIFIVGGATYAEAEVVANINKSTQGVRIILGGTTIHSSRRYVMVCVCAWGGGGVTNTDKQKYSLIQFIA